MLINEEREQLMDALQWLAWDEDHPLFSAVESIVRAARAQELRDAADVVKADRDNNGVGIVGEKWLRDRANHIESSQNG